VAIAIEAGFAGGADRCGAELVAFSSHRKSNPGAESNLRTKIRRMPLNVNGRHWMLEFPGSAGILEHFGCYRIFANWRTTDSLSATK
jgi:hypothetical protein